MEGGSNNNLLHQSTTKHVDQNPKMNKPTLMEEIMIYQNFVTNIKIYATNQQYTTRGSRNLSPTSMI